MKKVILVLMIIGLLQYAYADDTYGNVISGGRLLFTDVDVRVGEEYDRNVEYGDTIARKGDKDLDVTFFVKIMNNHTGLDMEDVELVASIEDLDLETADEVESISPLDDHRYELTLTLPNDVDEIDYDVLLEVKGEQNVTINKAKYELTLEVKFPDEEEDAVKEYYEKQLADSIKMINQSINDMHSDIQGYFKPYTDCTAQKIECEAQRDIKDEKITELEPYKDQAQQCEQTKTEMQNNFEGLQQRYRECQANMTAITHRSESEQPNWFLIFIVVAVLVYVGWMSYNKYSNPKGEVEKEGEIR